MTAPNMSGIAMEMLKAYALCDHCLGRQFAQLLTSTTNELRGRCLRYVCALNIDAMNHFEDLHGNFHDFVFRHCKIERHSKKRCFVCEDVFLKIDEIVENILKILEGYEYSTFLVGVVPSKDMVLHEERLWEEFGAEYAERLKEELSRAIGKKIHDITGKEVDFNNADITVIVDLRKNTLRKSIRSIYVYGRYNKYKEMPQTKWLCSSCKGIGCEKCEYSGKKYKESVEDLIGSVLLHHTQGTGTSFHGAGREDIDALCYGFREFVIEIHEPKKRSLDLSAIEKEINEKYKGIIEVKDLSIVDKKKVKEVKSKRVPKTYLVEVVCKDTLNDEDIKLLNNIKDLTINQQTPKRVEHRRADKVRKRKVYFVEVLEHKNNVLKLRIKAEAGTYIKEFIHGDEGRTRPSISSILGKKCEVSKLIVEKFGD